MSKEPCVSASSIDTVDVNNFAKENGTNSEKSSDSGFETTEAGSETFPASSDSETSPIKSMYSDEIEFSPNPCNIDNAAKTTNEIASCQSSASSSTISITPEDNCSSDYQNSEQSHNNNKSENTKELHIFDEHSVKTQNIDDLKETNVPEYEHSIKTPPSSLDRNSIQTTGLNASCECLDGNSSQIMINNLLSSSISLDKTLSCSLKKNQFSRSAENISLFDNTDDTTFSIKNNKLDKDEILTQFSIQKKQANATQRIPENIIQPTLDVRHTLIPKEILSQDIGSIVKNVHGMFSSVSGSLKYYTHRTVQKPVRNLKPIPNSKVMTDIFEDETNEVTKNQEIANSAEPIAEIKDQDLDPRGEVLRLQIESLERLLFEQRKENTSLRERVKQHVDECQEKDQMFKDLEGKLDLVSDFTQGRLSPAARAKFNQSKTTRIMCFGLCILYIN